MERPTSGVTEEAFEALTMDVKVLVQSLTNYVNEMGEYDENAYNLGGENFRHIDYTTRGQDCHYSPLFEDDFDNHYISNQYQEQYFDDHSSNLIFNSWQDDEEQEELSTLAQLMSQMLAAQAQQGKQIQLLMFELQQEKVAQKMLETQFAQQASSSSQNPEKFPLQPDVRLADIDAITIKSENILEEPIGKEKGHNEVVEDDEQPELEKEDENMEKEVATHQHVQTLDAHDRSSTPLEDIYLDHKIRKALEHSMDDCTIKEFLKCLAQTYHDHDDTLCAEDERVLESIKDEHIEFEDVEASTDQGHKDFVEISVDQILEEPFLNVDTSSKEYFGVWATKTIIGQLKESKLIKLKSNFEDQFFPPLPQDKFQSFLPFMSRSLVECYYNPFHLKEIKYNNGLIAQREVPRRLGGREYKWDLKLDTLQSIHCTA